MLYGLYRGFTTLFGPLAPLLLARRAARGKEDPLRRGERLGHASADRPEGRLVWIHAASVGEAMSAQILIDRLHSLHQGLHVLLTTGTVSSARLFEKRLPDATTHQYVPIDRPDCVRLFLDHWHPDCAIWLESELWPNLIDGVAQRAIPAILANARLSEKSFTRWSRVASLARRLIGSFALVLPGDEKSAERYGQLGARQIGPTGNLKYASAALPGDPALVDALAKVVAGRSVWLAASTHPGEEAFVLASHNALKTRFPDLLTILAPRHPPRGPDVSAMISEAGLTKAIRSAGEMPKDETDVFLVDTLGEMGVLYRVVQLVFLGGSLSPNGGHNPIEPAQLNCAILTGPLTDNNADIFAALVAEKAVRVVADGAALTQAAGELLADPSGQEAMARAAEKSARDRAAVIDQAMSAMVPVLNSVGIGQ